jgi:hypothetical protein
LLTELPDNSQAYAEAQKIIDRMAFDTVDTLQSYVRLVDPNLARGATAESKRG